MIPVIASSVPTHLHDVVSAYVSSAKHLSVDPHRVLGCACLLVAAQRRPECHLPPGATLSTVPYSSLAALLGLPEGSQPAEVAARYRRYRKATQEINLVARAARQRIKKLREVLEKHDEVLPEEFRLLAADLRRQADGLDPLMLRLLAAAHQSPAEKNPLRWRRPKEAHERFNVQQQALIWWEYWLHQGRGPQSKIWDDFYALAKVWRLTRCRDVDSLKRSVVRLTQGMTEIVALPGWCQKACQ